jgi:hypothetical protein
MRNRWLTGISSAWEPPCPHVGQLDVPDDHTHDARSTGHAVAGGGPATFGTARNDTI